MSCWYAVFYVVVTHIRIACLCVGLWVLYYFRVSRLYLCGYTLRVLLYSRPWSASLELPLVLSIFSTHPPSAVPPVTLWLQPSIFFLWPCYFLSPSCLTFGAWSDRLFLFSLYICLWFPARLCPWSGQYRHCTAHPCPSGPLSAVCSATRTRSVFAAGDLPI